MREIREEEWQREGKDGKTFRGEGAGRAPILYLIKISRLAFLPVKKAHL